MVTSRYKIWFDKFKNILERIGFEKIQLSGLGLIFFAILLVFSVKIMNTINSGIEAQRRSDKLALEVQKLEKEQSNLEYLKKLYSSESEIESEYRAVENKKKENEKIYYIITPTKEDESTTQPENTDSTTIEETDANWEKWLKKIFI